VADTDYITLESLKAALRLTNNTFDELLQMAITSASRQIDQFCDDQFWKFDAAAPRMFKAERPRRLLPGAFSTTDGLVVEVDLDNDGVYETTWVRGKDYQVTPPTPRPGWPYTAIEALGSAWFPGQYGFSPYYGYAYTYSPGYYGASFGGEWYPRSMRARVRVTAKWGWPTVPPQVRQACQILAIDQYKSKDLTNGAAGTTGLSTGAFGSQKSIQVTPAGFNTIAEALLCGLRDVVVA
jgi:hypothetical protein